MMEVETSLREGEYLSDGMLIAVRAESIRATLKHGFDNTNLNPSLPYLNKLANLMEEVGEVGQLFAYDKMADDYHEKLYIELIQVANLALAWAQAEEQVMAMHSLASLKAKAEAEYAETIELP